MNETAGLLKHTPQDKATLFKALMQIERFSVKAQRHDIWTYPDKLKLNPILKDLRRLYLQTYRDGFNKGLERLWKQTALEEQVVKDLEEIVVEENQLPDGDCLLFWWHLNEEDSFHEACKMAIIHQM